MNQIVDKNYCMSSFLTFRCIVDEKRVFKAGMPHSTYVPIPKEQQIACVTAADIDRAIRDQLAHIDLSHAAILLSGGMDSAILASYMPKGMRAYTAVCSAPNAIDESGRARQYCEANGLKHIFVDITWADYEESIDALMLQDGCPVFANEPQVYKLVKTIKNDGIDTIIFGDNADMAFGGMDRMLSRDWTYDKWVKRYTFVDPFDTLAHPVSMDGIYQRYRCGADQVDFIGFINDIFPMSSTAAYTNAFQLAGLNYFDPYACLKMGEPLDLKRVRSGESKYLIRELFRLKYPHFNVPEKIAMARAVDQWLANWNGPQREEFCIKKNIDEFSGEQKFMLYALERFLNLIDG